MKENKYAVFEEQRIVAENMTLHDALLLVKAIMEDAYADPCLAFTVKRMGMEG